MTGRPLVRAESPCLSKSRTARGFVDFIYPFHTGQIGGTAGRLMLMLIGAWLITMIVFCLKLWCARRAAA